MVLTSVSVSTLFTFVLFPLGVFVALAVALIPCLLSPGARLGGAIKALYCYILQTVGVAMMTAGALPAVYGVLEKFSTGGERFSAETYLALLILFSVGGIVFLWHEQMAERVDDASRRVPALLFWYTFKTIGNLLILAGVLSLLFTMLLTKPLVGAWWITPVVTFLYGLLVSWCTKSPTTSQNFRLMPLHAGMKIATVAKGKKK
ncbi:MAG: hypothetical protein HOO67_07320 [Candidatus Peribacteraceae bacterium]|nr:hypothetical protein [Candidatus Peribacteraceae bacterium]